MQEVFLILKICSLVIAIANLGLLIWIAILVNRILQKTIKIRKIFEANSSQQLESLFENVSQDKLNQKLAK